MTDISMLHGSNENCDKQIEEKNHSNSKKENTHQNVSGESGDTLQLTSCTNVISIGFVNDDAGSFQELHANEDDENETSSEDNADDSEQSDVGYIDDNSDELVTFANQDQFFAHIRATRRNCDDESLPKTVSVIKGSNGEKLYLIGTAHFSKESCEDVQKVISLVQPDAVVIELCASRTHVLTVDEEELKKMADENRYDQLKKCIKQKGLLSGLVLFMIYHMSAYITKQLGMPPGTEFRTAFNEAKRIPGCSLYLGDRPIEITLQRLLASLSLWQKLRFGMQILRELKPISAEDVEKLKEQDMFEQLLKEMVTEFPHMAKVIVSERDMFLAGYLQKVLKKQINFPEGVEAPPVVVGVVGIGHCNGIKAKLDTEITEEEMEEIQKLPPPSRSKKIVKLTIQGVLFAATLYTAYKLANWLEIYPRALQFQ